MSRPCPECRGDGEVVICNGYGIDPETPPSPCPECGGEGTLPTDDDEEVT